MYSRNLSRTTVRASPTYSSAVPKYTDLLRGQQQSEESRYGWKVPPGYDGSRFSRNLTETDTKHHTAPQREEVRVIPAEPQQTEQRESEENLREPWEVTPDAKTEEAPVIPSDPLGTFIASLKERISGEDLLLVVIILMLAADGENAEITILLLSLLLLIK